MVLHGLRQVRVMSAALPIRALRQLWFQKRKSRLLVATDEKGHEPTKTADNTTAMTGWYSWPAILSHYFVWIGVNAVLKILSGLSGSLSPRNFAAPSASSIHSGFIRPSARIFIMKSL